MGYSIFLDGIHLPVTTEKISVKNSLRTKEYDVLGQGQIQKPEGQDLRTVSFATEFPGQVYGYVEESAFQSPGKLIAKLRELQEGKKPFRFVAVGEDKLTMQVTLEQLDTAEQGGEEGDYEASIRLKEYREFGVKTTDIPNLPRPGAVPQLSKTVTLAPGQTLMDKISPTQKKLVESAGKSVLAFSMGKVINPAVIPPYKTVEIRVQEAYQEEGLDQAKITSQQKLAHQFNRRLETLWEEKMGDVGKKSPELG